MVGFPGDLTRLLGCVQAIPIVNPDPVCGSLVEVVPLLACIGDCSGSAVCLAQCTNQHVTIQIGKVRSGDVEVEYASHRTGTRFSFTWDDDMEMTSTQDGSVIPRSRGINYDDLRRYDSPYIYMAWESNVAKIHHCGEAANLNFSMPIRDSSSSLRGP
jgi:hypothetical protein